MADGANAFVELIVAVARRRRHAPRVDERGAVMVSLF